MPCLHASNNQDKVRASTHPTNYERRATQLYLPPRNLLPPKTGRINPAVKKKPPHGQENVTNIANQNNQIQTSSNQSSFSFERYWAKAGTTNRSPNNYQPERLKPDPEDLELEDRELERDREPPKEIPPDRREDLELPILVQLLDAR